MNINFSTLVESQETIFQDMHFWDKLHSVFHAGSGPLYNLLYLCSRKVVTLSWGLQGHTAHGTLGWNPDSVPSAMIFSLPMETRLLCHWGQFSNLLVIKPAEKFLSWFPHTWSWHRASTQRKSWGRTHHRAQSPFVTLSANGAEEK